MDPNSRRRRSRRWRTSSRGSSPSTWRRTSSSPARLRATKSRLKLHIRPALGRLRLDEIDKQSEQRLKAAMKQFDPGTINDTLAVLSRLLNCAAEWGVIGSAPRFAKLKTRQTEIEFFDFDDFERLVDGARKVDPAVLAFVLLAGEAGLQRGEIIALDLTDADFRRGQLTIARSDWYGQIGTTKGRQDATGPDDDAPYCRPAGDQAPSRTE